MSLYGDLPPPGSSADTTSPAKKTESDTKDGAATSSSAAKSALPAGWSSSITRLKPMLNRKLAPPKARPMARNIPSGFVAQSSEVQNSTMSTSSSTDAPTVTSATKQDTSPLQATATATITAAVDESSWLRERTAQVQRQDSEAMIHARKQMKKIPVKGISGPMSLDDDYDIARPNDYEEFKMLFDDERRQREEDKRMAGEDAGERRPGYQHSGSRSRSRSLVSIAVALRREGVDLPELRDFKGSLLPRNGVQAQTRCTLEECDPGVGAESEQGAGAEVEEGGKAGAKVHIPGETAVHGRDLDRIHLIPGDAHPVLRVGTIRAQQVEAKEDPPLTPTTAAMNDASGEDAFLRRARLSQQQQHQRSHVGDAAPAPNHESQTHGRPTFVASTQQAPSKGLTSSVILLTNMVGPGEVDDTLQEETATECAKYGAVVRCLIYEVQNGKVSPEEAVRIFVKFGAVASAERALRDLDGRFFGGRQVRGQFFDERRFDQLQLAP
ncbi:hypothetical protein BGX34_008321 [Mortierella sp. NVP85]|nr:hypothetical protein BGX34_008321 [Mortierella sp. NVP85]